MPKLDLTPAETPEELESLVKYSGSCAKEQTIKGNTDGTALFKEFQREYEIELYVAEFIASIKRELICR